MKGLPTEWSPEFIRDEAVRQLELANEYIMAASPDLVGVLAVDAGGLPVEVTEAMRDSVILRKATDEPEVMPSPAEFSAVEWSPKHD